MKRIFSTAACLSLLTLPAWVSAAQVPAGLKPGQLSGLRRDLLREPNSPQLNTTLGVALTNLGEFSQASVCLERGRGDSLGELFASADASRNLGRPEQAHDLLTQALLLPISDSDQVVVLLRMAQSARSAAMTERAWADAQRALAIQPRAKSVHALLAEIALDLGDTQLAEQHIFLAELRTPGALPIQLLQVQARLAMLQGDLYSAREYIDQARKQRRWAPHSVALDAQLLLAEGDPHLALERLERRALLEREDLELLETKTLVLEALHLDQEAESYRALLRALRGQQPGG